MDSMNLNMNRPELFQIRQSLDEAIERAIKSAGDGQLSTISLTIKIETLAIDDTEDRRFLPIEFSCNVNTKRDLMKDKGVVGGNMVVRKMKNGELEVVSEQISFFDSIVDKLTGDES